MRAPGRRVPQHLGGLLIVAGLVPAAGVLVLLVGRIPLIGRLPGDIYIKKRNVAVYVPIATSILISIILALIAGLLGRRG